MDGLFPPVTELLPHRGRSVIIDEVLVNSENSICVSTLITRKHPFFVNDYGVPAWTGIEYMAQAIAAHAGLENRHSRKSPHIGMLLGVRNYRTERRYFQEGMRLEISASRDFGDARGIAACTCTIQSDGKVLAQAKLIIIETEMETGP